MTLEACPHHFCRGAKARLCLATRRARVHTTPWSRDGRIAVLLADLVRGHELDAHGTDAERDQHAARMEEQLDVLEGKAVTTKRRAA